MSKKVPNVHENLETAQEDKNTTMKSSHHTGSIHLTASQSKARCFILISIRSLKYPKFGLEVI